jgi:hypothetical protein
MEQTLPLKIPLPARDNHTQRYSVVRAIVSGHKHKYVGTGFLRSYGGDTVAVWARGV